MTQNDNTQHSLGIILWDVANQLRGAMMADDFRDYMLSFLFLKYLSDSYEKSAKILLGDDYTHLTIWYKSNPDDVELFEKQMRKRNHYVILPQYLWSNIAELARTQDADLLDTLDRGFKYIENDSFESSFKGLFSEINLHSDKLGKDYTNRNTLLARVITKINEKLNVFSNDSDYLGDAYEYLIGQFAAGSGQKAGEFYTPQNVSTILSKIVILDCQNPKIEKPRLNNVLDFACGSGSLLLNVRRQMGTKVIGKIYGQEKNITTYNLARMNMLLHGVKDSEFEIHHGDTLINDWDILKEVNPSLKIEFDAIVANPPFSLRWDPTEQTADDFRFSRYGVAPKSAADFAFLLHGFHYLSDDGTMAIILPHGVLFRGGKEEAIRKKLIEDDNIDAVIGLPANLFYSTGIPVCILVLKKCRRSHQVLFINASEHYFRGKRQNFLLEEDINLILDVYQNRSNVPRFSRCVSLSEIKENDYNLNITRYVNLSVEEEPINLQDVSRQLKEVDAKIEDARARHNAFLKELGLEEI